MRKSVFLWAIVAVLLFFSACSPSREQLTDQAIRQVMDEFLTVGICGMKGFPPVLDQCNLSCFHKGVG